MNDFCFTKPTPDLKILMVHCSPQENRHQPKWFSQVIATQDDKGTFNSPLKIEPHFAAATDNTESALFCQSLKLIFAMGILTVYFHLSDFPGEPGHNFYQHSRPQLPLNQTLPRKPSPLGFLFPTQLHIRAQAQKHPLLQSHHIPLDLRWDTEMCTAVTMLTVTDLRSVYCLSQMLSGKRWERRKRVKLERD